MAAFRSTVVEMLRVLPLVGLLLGGCQLLLPFQAGHDAAREGPRLPDLWAERSREAGPPLVDVSALLDTVVDGRAADLRAGDRPQSHDGGKALDRPLILTWFPCSSRISDLLRRCPMKGGSCLREGAT